MDRALAWFASHRRASTVLIAAYVLAVSTQHEEVQGFVIAAMQKATANAWLTAVGWTFRLVFLAVTIFLLHRVLGSEGGRRKAAYWTVTVVFTFAAVRWLSVNNNEFVHFLQYALLTFPIFSLSRSFGQTAVWTTLCGAFDEGWQYAVLHAGWGIPYDFNDVIMNSCGAGLGVVWICSTASMVPVSPAWRAFLQGQWSGWGWRTALGLLAVGLLLLASGQMMIYEPKSGPKPLLSLSRLEPKPFWFFDATWGPKAFHILHPVEGVLLMGFLFCVYSTLDRQWKWTGGPTRIQREAEPPNR
ncbi:MAG: VanZ family protein [Bryobacterales bacterium]|nr:VanZ family protein [Bryobacterales bacterium]